jgi:TRAP-type mannitol/chloroaromatic compound transport system permease small subunit
MKSDRICLAHAKKMLDMFDQYQKPARFRDSWVIRIGAILFLLGVGPLLLLALTNSIGLSDSNPDVTGILAFLTFWPSIGILLVGFLLVIRENEKRR